MKTALFLSMIMLSGCATTREFALHHQTVIAIGAAVLVGSLAASSEEHQRAVREVLPKQGPRTR